jgi:hypothetical protein
MLNKPRITEESTPPAENEDTIGSTAPDFFMEDDEPALRARAGWTERHLGLSDGFYARFLRIPEASFRDWRLGQAELPADQQEVLRKFWWTVLFLLGSGHINEQRGRGLLERKMPVDETSHPHPHDPPWIGSTMKSFLEEGGPDALPAVNRWLGYFQPGGGMWF